MSKMIDLGHTETAEISTAVKGQSKRRKEYPTIWINKVDLPFEPSDVGKSFKIQAMIHVTGIEQRADEGRKASKTYNLELRSMAVDHSRKTLRQAIKKNLRR